MTGFWRQAPAGRRAWPAPARRRSAAGLAVWLAVLLGHGLLALGLASALRPLAPASIGAAAPALLWLRLAPHRAAEPRPAGLPPRPPSRVVPNRALPDARPARASPPAVVPAPTQAGNLADGADGADGASRAIDAARAPDRPASHPAHTPATAPALTAQPPTAPAPAAALNLALPRPAAARRSATAAAQVHDDARRGSPPSRDERLAQALGTDLALHEEQRGAVRRFRQGRACVDVAPAREAQINPFNQTASPTPRQATPC